jgi:hypothetical protein
MRNGEGRRALVPDLRLSVTMMSSCRYVTMMSSRRWCGCRDTVKRINTAWRGNTVAMMHYRRIVKSRGRQWAHG